MDAWHLANADEDVGAPSMDAWHLANADEDVGAPSMDAWHLANADEDVGAPSMDAWHSANADEDVGAPNTPSPRTIKKRLQVKGRSPRLAFARKRLLANSSHWPMI